MKRKKITLRAISISLVLILMSTASVFASSAWIGYTETSFPYTLHMIARVEQAKDNWCWAACAEMAGKFYYEKQTGNTSGRNQAAVVYNTFGDYRDSRGTSTQTANGYMYVGYSYPYIGPPFSTFYAAASDELSYSDIRTDVYADKPKILGFSYTGGGGHMVVLTGFNDNGAEISDDEIWLIDPSNDANKENTFWVDYEDFVSRFSYYGFAVQWSATVNVD